MLIDLQNIIETLLEQILFSLAKFIKLFLAIDFPICFFTATSITCISGYRILNRNILISEDVNEEQCHGSCFTAVADHDINGKECKEEWAKQFNSFINSFFPHNSDRPLERMWPELRR